MSAAERDVPEAESCPLENPAVLDDLAMAGVIQYGAGDSLASPPALTVATALLSQGLELEQVRHLVSTADRLAQQVCECLRATVAEYGDDVAAECALSLAKLLCADALTTPPEPETEPAPARTALRLVPKS